jgi:hypothetical protein
MLISMPTDTSTIFGVFQFIGSSQGRREVSRQHQNYGHAPRHARAQTPAARRYFSLGQDHFAFGQAPTHRTQMFGLPQDDAAREARRGIMDA